MIGSVSAAKANINRRSSHVRQVLKGEVAAIVATSAFLLHRKLNLYTPFKPSALEDISSSNEVADFGTPIWKGAGVFPPWGNLIKILVSVP